MSTEASVTYEVTPATPADAETLATYNVALALETEGRRLDGPTVLGGVRALLEDPAKGRYLVARSVPADGDSGEAVAAEPAAGEVPAVTADGHLIPVGQLMLTVEWSDWRNAPIWWIQSVYVHPKHRRRGIFRMLCRKVFDEAKAAGVANVRLYVERHNDTARATYHSLGFKQSGYVVLEK